jgi:hypothetical protein
MHCVYAVSTIIFTDACLNPVKDPLRTRPSSLLYCMRCIHRDHAVGIELRLEIIAKLRMHSPKVSRTGMKRKRKLSYSGGVGILIGPLPRSGIPFLRSSRFGHSCFYLQVDPPMDLRSDRHATVDESTMFCNIVNIIIQFDSITIFILLR